MEYPAGCSATDAPFGSLKRSTRSFGMSLQYDAVLCRDVDRPLRPLPAGPQPAQLRRRVDQRRQPRILDLDRHPAAEATNLATAAICALESLLEKLGIAAPPLVT